MSVLKLPPLDFPIFEVHGKKMSVFPTWCVQQAGNTVQAVLFAKEGLHPALMVISSAGDLEPLPRTSTLWPGERVACVPSPCSGLTPAHKGTVLHGASTQLPDPPPRTQS